MSIIITGLLLGGTYALIAVGLTLQYGVARIMNLANGENLVFGCFIALWLFAGFAISPILGTLIVAPVAFAVNWLIYSWALRPLVKRAKTRGQLEVDSILSTFGLTFIFQGIMLLTFGGQVFKYSYLADAVPILGVNYGLNRVVAFLAAVVITGALWLFLHRTRYGTAIRAVAVDPVSASLVAIDVPRAAAFAFALGGALTASSGVLFSSFYAFNASMGITFTMKALIVVIMGGVGDVRGAVIAALLLGLAETAVASLVDPGLTIAATYALFILVLLFRPQGLFGAEDHMMDFTRKEWRIFGIAAALFAAAALLPFADQGFYLSLSLNIVMYVVLCTAWTLFSGPTHYISLATAAFFGVGTYATALGINVLPFPLLVLIGAGAAAILAGLVGLATLRLSGVYFVIFTLGLAELARQLVTWLQTHFGSALGLYVLTGFREMHIYWMLLGVGALVYLTGFLINRSRLGFAMRIIGNDETVAKHVGIDTAQAKIILFVVSGAFIGAVGAILAPRYSYITSPAAFNPMISFQVVIMALLGGTNRLWGPLLGVIPFTILFDQISARFPNHTSLVIGIAFMAIVYLLPRGVLGLWDDIVKLRKRFRLTTTEEKAAT